MRITPPTPTQQKKNREARHAALRSMREQRVRTRMLILLGSWVAGNTHHPAALHVINSMDGWLQKDAERHLFSLPPKARGNRGDSSTRPQDHPSQFRGQHAQQGGVSGSGEAP